MTKVFATDARERHLDSIESEISNLVKESIAATPAPAPVVFVKPPGEREIAVPTYVKPQEGVPDVGRLAAAALTQQFETVALQVEGMGSDLKDVAKRCVDMVDGVQKLLKEIETTAQHCRDEGKTLFTQVETCTKATDEVRNVLQGVRSKLGMT